MAEALGMIECRGFAAVVEAGVRGAQTVGEVVSTHVIARPHTNIDLVLPLGRAEEATAEVTTKGKR
jgi:ethanolamine utilization protein EutM/ethanolamine utilization protein EutN